MNWGRTGCDVKVTLYVDILFREKNDTCKTLSSLWNLLVKYNTYHPRALLAAYLRGLTLSVSKAAWLLLCRVIEYQNPSNLLTFPLIYHKDEPSHLAVQAEVLQTWLSLLPALAEEQGSFLMRLSKLLQFTPQRNHVGIKVGSVVSRLRSCPGFVIKFLWPSKINIKYVYWKFRTSFNLILSIVCKIPHKIYMFKDTRFSRRRSMAASNSQGRFVAAKTNTSSSDRAKPSICNQILLINFWESIVQI